MAAFSVDRQPWIPGFEPPYIVAIVEIAEQPDVRLITNVVDVEPEDMSVGLEVEVFFEDWTDFSGDEDSRVWIPLFRPVIR
ncbi:putative OB-fold protein [Mycolicibacterium sp. BK634]|nr:putative OB-fold protein [Mycolicibacterium sp. BK634]